MKIIYLKNFRRGLATNSSSTHSLIYKNDNEVFNDLNIFECDYYDRCTDTIAASREAKIKYVLACIMWDEALVKIMSSFYPEMKEYYPLIKKKMMARFAEVKNYDDDSDEYAFGMYVRGDLSFESDNIEASVDYLRNVIEDPEIIIVGGSDEQDFVYDTIENHVECPDPDMIRYFGKYKGLGVSKNGNYWVGYGDTNDRILVKKWLTDEDRYYHSSKPIKNSFMGKIRYMTEKGEPIPDFPELIDLKITNACQHNCPQCFMASNPKGKHANPQFLRDVVYQCGDAAKSKHHRVEFSIGGGNILLYPGLEDFLKFLKEMGHIANVTINAQDCETIIKNKKFTDIFEKYIDGIGVSLTSVDDVDELHKLYKKFSNKKNCYETGSKYIVAHLIPEYLGLEKTMEIIEKIRKSNMYVNYLFLGYKTNGRGADCDYHVFTNDELDELFKDTYSMSIDTTFANRYFNWIKDNFSYEYTITMNEGEYSMYIDGVEEKAYKSSYQLDKPYNMHADWSKRETEPWLKVGEAFKEIRKDGGFKVFDESENHYWS